MLYFSNRIFGQSTELSWYLYWLSWGLWRPLDALGWCVAFLFALGIVLGYIAVKTKTTILLTFSLGVVLCPIILAILGNFVPAS